MPRPPKPRKTRQPVGNALRGFVEARKSSNITILSEIRTHVVAEGNLHAGEGREAHKIHVSELVKSDRCPRRMYYKVSRLNPTDLPKGAYHRLEMIWAAGHAEHAKWQKWLREMGVLYGTWRCMLCRHTWATTSPKHCPNCGEDEEFLEYLEVELEDPQYPLVGHADGAVPSRKCFIEIKSFSAGTVRVEDPKRVKEYTVETTDGKSILDHEGLWKSINRPLRSHLNQGVMYLWMAKRMGLDFESIVFIYENKTTQDTKAFEVSLSDRIAREFVEILEEVDEAVSQGVVPERPEGFKPDGRPCNECPFKTHCWSDDDTSTTSARVQARRSRSRSSETGRASEVRAARASRGEASEGARGSDRTRRSRVHGPDDRDDSVGRAPERATRAGRGGRAPRGSGDGEGTRSGISRNRQGRYRA